MRDGTRVVRAGFPAFAQGEPFLPGPTFANPYHLAGDPSSSPYSYGRYHNPTWTHFEQALMEVWLAHRSLATLGIRLERQCKNALEIARFLASRPEVKRVRYPGLPQDPAHPLAARQMKQYGLIVSFVLEGKRQAEHFLAACHLILQATSFGGVHTTAERRARWGGDAIPDGFIRLSVGCEDIQDLLDDITQALATVSTAEGNHQ